MHHDKVFSETDKLIVKYCLNIPMNKWRMNSSLFFTDYERAFTNSLTSRMIITRYIKQCNLPFNSYVHGMFQSLWEKKVLTGGAEPLFCHHYC